MSAAREPDAELFAEASDPPVRGFLHRAVAPNGDAMVLAHGAGSSSQAPLLVAVARAFADAGVAVLRCDLPFRQARPTGPPRPGDAARDREGLRNAVHAVRRLGSGRVFLGGHSYGGRQASLLAADEPALAAGLLLFAYPLHPPRRPAELRTAHFPRIRVPVCFVHGSRDPFGSLEELRAAIALIPARTALVPIDGAGHDLLPSRRAAHGAIDLAPVVTASLDLVDSTRGA
jgi:predicted alpha/beta-hydrolase family hydrolase